MSMLERNDWYELEQDNFDYEENDTVSYGLLEDITIKNTLSMEEEINFLYDEYEY